MDIRCSKVDNPGVPDRKWRKLDSKNVQSVERYLKMVLEKVGRQNLEGRLCALEGKNSFTEGDALNLKLIDDTMTKIMLVAEEKLHENGQMTCIQLNYMKSVRKDTIGSAY